jgi:hypothetical protein
MSQIGDRKVPPGIFDNVQSDFYWSSTTYEANSDYAWYVSLYAGSGRHHH